MRLIIVGTGAMARSHANAFAEIDGVSMVAAVDLNPDALSDFMAEFDIPRGFASLDEALAWGEFDAAANVTPDLIHHRTTMPLLRAGKHVLCEKPLASNHADAVEMAKAAADAGVVNMVNLTYRNVPAVMQAAQMVRDGAIGDVRHFEASYLQSWLTQNAWGNWDKDPQWLWRLSTDHGSMGVLGDVGVHILDFATLVAGADVTSVSCRLQTFEKAPDGKIGEYTLDANDSMAMHLALDSGAIGVLHASRFASGHLNDLRLRIYGTLGGLDVRYEDAKSQLFISTGDDLLTGTWQPVDTPDVPTNFARFAKAVQDGEQVYPDFARGAALQQVLDLALWSDTDQRRGQVVRAD
ncbi:MAG: Gfo/Idh/MocA family oxidoreductase [Pseudomonadota bacterium]